MEALFYIGIIFVLGAFIERFSPLVYVPRVVGYLLVGLIIGPQVLGLVPQHFIEDSHIVTDLALSIIALLAGATLKAKRLNGHIKEIVLITIFQSLTTFFVVASGFIFLGDILELPMLETTIAALILGAIATATAPATPLALVHELHAKGNFTSTLLAVVAADDAISLIVFSLAVTVAVSLMQSDTYSWQTLLTTLNIVFLSVLIGVVAAFLNRGFEKLFAHHKGMETISTLGLIFVVYSLSQAWHLEPLLSAMVMGIVITNISEDFDLVEEEIDKHLAQIIFILFFMLSAMHLKLEAFFSLPLAIVAYIVLRFFGKYVGSFIGASVAKSSSNVKKYMGAALIPQAGVAIGLVLSLQERSSFEALAPMLLNIIIATTLIHEIIGPFLTRYALEKSQETAQE
ncbi:cation:proton antiporter [Sulfurimonas sp.]|jgi:Kef-type K+ transport system membrane component KefB|uniref:cation:proton antiporter n=1 Tax=Sulfurimonas sp. TaxID=2022749 RepID=UPI002A35AD3E|nr:cation:proton antiporter [Sulfurimonas sp.]MDY0123051.1 cation:proton antiporter [Sulfurimonas sp.]